MRLFTIKGAGRIHQQTFIDAYTRVTFVKRYDGRTPWWPSTCSMTARYYSLKSKAYHS
jgi:hypothetical protein